MFYQFHHLDSPQYVKIERDRDFSFPPHLHRCFEIIVLLSGEMSVTVGQECVTLRAGEAVVVFPNQIHSLESQQSEHVLCIFSPHLVRAYAAQVTQKAPRLGKFCPSSHLVEALLQMSPDVSVMEKKGLLYSLCAEFDRCAVYGEKEAGDDMLLHKIFSFVETAFTGNCSLGALSRALGYDYAYLSRFFKQTVGVSFNTYVTHYRLSCVCELLKNTDMPIVQCAYESGFHSLRSFNRNFRQFLQKTPHQYREDV